MNCRPGCGACCIAPSISSAIPGMPSGKPANIRCAQLSRDNHCLIFGKQERPKVCASFQADPETCGCNQTEALQTLIFLEKMTL
jgi:Fe-S-cluster containining protein